MCASIPGQIIDIFDPQNRLAYVEISGQRRVVNLSLLPPEEAVAGEWVLVQAGLAVECVSPEDVEQISSLLEEIERFYEEDIP